jgi:hypothetical protein
MVPLAPSDESSVDASELTLAPGTVHTAKDNPTTDWTKVVTKPKPPSEADFFPDGGVHNTWCIRKGMQPNS